VTPLYFAYGSNLCLGRMRERVASARVVGPARVAGYRLALDKRGADGSGKANLVPDAGAGVWGVVYAIAAGDWTRLDACEPGYARIEVEARTPQRPLAAWTYRARILTDDPVAFDWYKRLIVEGAREHGLPEEWLETLAGLPERSDPRSPGPR
jgi:gamma-glutamylcyclotransferase